MIKLKSLTPNLIHILVEKGTEPPFSGKYCNKPSPGTFLCRGCGAPLFRADSHFTSSCGWPSFDDEIKNAISYQTDKDGVRTEITCTACGGHLGHVFNGEGLTPKNKRHCVNSLSIEFTPSTTVTNTEEAIIAGGCFWGIQHLFDQLEGVLITEVGYSGGHTDSPTYHEVCSGNTGHVEATRVVYDAEKLSYQDVIKYFFEIHNPQQSNGQGPDIGNQYLSKIFVYDENQKSEALSVIDTLEKNIGKIATKVLPVCVFWSAESYHQHYYQKNNKAPYCHQHTKKF